MMSLRMMKFRVTTKPFLILSIITTLLFISYQLMLIFHPIIFPDLDTKYQQLVDQYQVTKMQRLVLEEQLALANTKKRSTQLVSTIQNKPVFSLTKPNHSSFHDQEISLSLEQTKTFEQLEAYMSNNASAPASLTNDENNLLAMRSDEFTLQIMGVRDINELRHFVSENNLQEAHIFHTYYLSKDWYVLVYGRFPNHSEALKSIETLPPNLRNLKPWVRQLGSVQKAIQLRR